MRPFSQVGSARGKFSIASSPTRRVVNNAMETLEWSDRVQHSVERVTIHSLQRPSLTDESRLEIDGWKTPGLWERLVAPDSHSFLL